MLGGKAVYHVGFTPCQSKTQYPVLKYSNRTKTMESSVCMGLLSGCMQCEGVLILAANLAPQQEHRKTNK